SFEVTEGLSLQAIKTLTDEIGTLVDRQSHGDAWARQIASPLLRQPARIMRSAQISAKYGTMVSFPGSTEWKRPLEVTPISYRRSHSLAGSYISVLPHATIAPPLTLTSGRLSAVRFRSEVTILERARKVPPSMRERSGSGGYVAQSGGVTSLEIACKHS